MPDNANKRSMPMSPKLTLATIGPGAVMIAMGLGSGEYIIWPYMIAQFGFGLLWGALVGVTIQLFLSNECGRYTLATGENVFVAFRKLSKYFPTWFAISTFLSFAWPGIIGLGGEILGQLLGVGDHKWLTVIMLVVIGLLLTFGGEVYTNLEKWQKRFILVSIPLIVLLAALVLSPEIVVNVGKGLVGAGEGYWFLPAGISLGSFLGAIAYAGSGGNLLTAQSFYLQDEGLGMAKYKDSQIKVGKVLAVSEDGQFFEQTPENVSRFKGFMRFTFHEQLVTFWLIGLFSIILLGVIAYALAYPTPQGENLGFLLTQAQALATRFFPAAGVFFLLVGVVFLFTTQLGVLEATSRIISENLLLASKKLRGVGKSRLFFILIWSQIAFGILVALLQLAAPLQVLFVNTFFSAISAFVLSVSLVWLSYSRVFPKALAPSTLRKAILVVSALFLGFFVVVTVADLLT